MENEEKKFTEVIKPVRMGIDVGSTTVKVVALGEKDEILYSAYERHRADIRNTIITVVNKALDTLEGILPAKDGQTLSVKVTGSGGLSVSQWLNVPFIQEVVAATTSVKKIIPTTDVVIELGGEDAKITYFTGGVEQRMNGTCAGGTGAFIDQMAALLETDASGLNELARGATTIYPIAARCGVFAKTDIQPLINEGARREDIAASIFQAVVNQTISGLACGKPIRGNVAFLGGPLHFLPELKKAFIRTLKLTPVQYDQSCCSSISASPSISLRVLMPKWRSTSRVMYIYGMLFGSPTNNVDGFRHKGRAIRRPEMSCEPPVPGISALPAIRRPSMSRGT